MSNELRLSKRGGSVEIDFGGPEFKTILAIVRELPGRKFNPDRKIWTVPINTASDVIEQLNQYLTVEQSLQDYLNQQEQDANKALAHRVDLRDQWLSDHSLGKYTLPGGFTHKAYQHEAIGQMIERGRVILADDMGLGKTQQALAAANAYKLPIIIVCPASLIDNWRKECQMAGVDNFTIDSDHYAKIPEPPDHAFTLIVDEAHRFQNRKSKRSKSLKALAERCTALFMLTGTPIPNGQPQNLFNLLKLLGHPLGDQFMEYARRYCAAYQNQWGWVFTGASNLDELREKVGDSMIRRTKDQVLTELPPKTRVFRQIESGGTLERDYKDAVRETFGAQRDDLDWVRRRMMKIRQIASQAKIPLAIELTDEILDQGGSVVLFCEFLATANALATHYEIPVYTGETNIKERQPIVDAFQSGDNRVFVGTTGAAGVGITLHKSSTVLLVDRPWRPGDAIQAEDRLHRIGQHHPVLSIWLQAFDIDRIIDDILIQKQEVVKTIMGARESDLEGESTSDNVMLAAYKALGGIK